MKRKIIVALLVMLMTIPLIAASRRELRPFAVPSRYLITRTGGSGTGTIVHPMRWPSGSTINFFIRGTQPGAIDGGQSSFAAAANAWTNDPTSNVTILYGGPTTADAQFTDGISSIQFDDPDAQIPGSYSVGAFTSTGDLTVARMNHAAISLGDTVLVTGGTDGTNVLPSAEIYSGGTFAPTTGAMNTARQNHTTTRLQTGEVLVAGGSNGTTSLASADIFDPATGLFATTTGALNDARANHTATELLDQTILFAGGDGASGRLASAELYEPSNQTFTPTGSMAAARTQHTAIRYGSTFVLVAGGSNGPDYLAGAEIFDTDTGTFSATGSPLNTARSRHTATMTSNGIVVIGGLNQNGPVATAEFFRENDDVFIEAAGPMITPRYGHQATLVPDGTVLITGGFAASGNPVDSAEVFNPDTGVFAPLTIQMTTARASHTATRFGPVNNEKILVAGGRDANPLNSADLCDPPSSVRLGMVNLYTDFTTYDFVGVTFWTLTEADIVLQDGLPATFTSGAGFDQLMAGFLGFALGFGATTDPAVLNPVFDITAFSPGATLQAYDATALAVVYPVCPVIAGQSDSQMVASGQSATLSVDAIGGDLTYQWYQGAVPDTTTPVGSSLPNYTTPAITAPANYWVRVSNNCGHHDSTTIAITIGLKGDANGDGSVNAGDIAALINQLFGGGTPSAASDLNGDGEVTFADLFYLINLLFAGGAGPV